MKRVKKGFKAHLALWTLLGTAALGGIGVFVLAVDGLVRAGEVELWTLWGLPVLILAGGCLSVVLIFPGILTVANLVFLFWRPADQELRLQEKNFEYVTSIAGILLGAVTFCFLSTGADWDTVIYENATHSPVWTQGLPTVVTLSCVGVAGYVVLSLVPLEKLPPLVTVCSMAGMYLGVLECILWIIQTMSAANFYCWIFPVNGILIAIKTIREKVRQWNDLEHNQEREWKSPWLARLNGWLMDARRWPLAAFLLMWPLLGIFIAVLALFGQQPDTLVKAWTETADWNLSNRIPPESLPYDGHYLCTVAAGGHKKVVKPQRLGWRHDHVVIVNRQLCVANAFEQVLEERTPRFHRAVRRFYDTYGLPVAKLIRSPWAADAVYFLMKPLEWAFLAVLYFCDVNPESRIARQYLPKGWEEGGLSGEMS